MDRERLTALLDDPARVRRDDIADLKAMADRYPWFSAAHLLLAVGGHREGDVLFDEQLRASAAHLPSRTVLFDQLHHPLPLAPAPVVPAPEPAPSPIVATGIIEVAEAPVLRIVPEEPPPATPAEEVIAGPVPVSAAVAPHEDPAPQADAVAPVGEEVGATPASAPSDPEDEVLSEHLRTPWKDRLLGVDRDEEELDRQMRDSAVAISYELLLESEGKLEAVPDVPEADVPVVAPPPPPPVQTPPPTPLRARRFGDWLSEGVDEGIAPPTRTVVAPRTSAASPVTDPEIVRVVRDLPPLQDPKHAPETAETKALIERFIQQNAQQAPTPKKAEFFNPQTAAKRSLEEHADLVTETLARIYEKQGNMAKAIAAYERLAVKHPEKAAHFKALAKGLGGK
ncbi:MAG TPA: tetratricopeptide repeat protein [Flavobacteriales bacterium]|mgnify:CR=1 FL=1|nr:tetratricopeptide repeat protein [Flavobacteriales bacterium]